MGSNTDGESTTSPYDKTHITMTMSLSKCLPNSEHYDSTIPYIAIPIAKLGSRRTKADRTTNMPPNLSGTSLANGTTSQDHLEVKTPRGDHK